MEQEKRKREAKERNDQPRDNSHANQSASTKGKHAVVYTLFYNRVGTRLGRDDNKWLKCEEVTTYNQMKNAART